MADVSSRTMAVNHYECNVGLDKNDRLAVVLT